jgi:hypothetical protein
MACREIANNILAGIRMNASIYFIVSALWVIIISAIFFRKSFATKKKKNSSNRLHLKNDAGSVFGKSQSQVETFFLPVGNKNSSQKNENADGEGYVDEINIDAFEVEYKDGDLGLDFSRYPSDAFAEEEESNNDSVPVQGISFEDIRRAVNVVKNGETPAMLTPSAAQQTRRVFKMLDETELLEKMRNIIPEISVRMEAFMDENNENN